jgi:hypothetical protein
MSGIVHDGELHWSRGEAVSCWTSGFSCDWAEPEGLQLDRRVHLAQNHNNKIDT